MSCLSSLRFCCHTCIALGCWLREIPRRTARIMTWADSLRATCRGDGALAEAVIHAVQTLLDRDAYLLRADVNERTVTHRLAVYVEQAFPDWDVDCEYNRDGHDPKEIAFGSGDDAEHGSRVFPDVIVHKRGRRTIMSSSNSRSRTTLSRMIVTSRSCAAIVISSVTSMVCSSG